MIREMNKENNGLKTFIKRMRSKIKKMYNGDKYGYGEDLEQLEYYARKKDLIVYEKENEILAITFISKEIEEDSWILGEFEGVVYDIIAIDYDIKVDFLNEMSKMYPNVLVYEYNFGYHQYKEWYEGLNLKSRIKSEEKIVISDNYLKSYNSTVNIEEIIEKKEKKQTIKELKFERIDMNKEGGKERLKEIMKDELEVNDGSNNIKYQGFHYVTKSDMFGCRYEKPKNLNYFLAIATLESGKEKVVGVLKIQDYILNKEKDYVGLNYINTHSSYYKQGIAKKLYGEINKYFEEQEEEIIFISSRPSEMGKKIKINELRKKIITSIQTYESIEEYYEVKIKNS